jgi:hypothetical protein
MKSPVVLIFVLLRGFAAGYTIEQQQMIRVAAGALRWMDPGRASEVVSKLDPGPARDQEPQDLFNDWTRSDAKAAQAFLHTLPEEEQQRLHLSMARALIQSDPEQAIAYLKDQPVDDPAHGISGNLARAIADQSSPEKALEWARGLQDEASRQQALPEIFSRMAAQDRAKAAEEALRFPASSSREESLVCIGGVWARNDFHDALAWARGLTGKDRESALGAVLTQGAPYQPTTAAAEYAEMLVAGRDRGRRKASGFLRECRRDNRRRLFRRRPAEGRRLGDRFAAGRRPRRRRPQPGRTIGAVLCACHQRVDRHPDRGQTA